MTHSHLPFGSNTKPDHRKAVGNRLVLDCRGNSATHTHTHSSLSCGSKVLGNSERAKVKGRVQIRVSKNGETPEISRFLLVALSKNPKNGYPQNRTDPNDTTKNLQNSQPPVRKTNCHVIQQVPWTKHGGHCKEYVRFQNGMVISLHDPFWIDHIDLKQNHKHQQTFQAGLFYPKLR